MTDTTTLETTDVTEQSFAKEFAKGVAKDAAISVAAHVLAVGVLAATGLVIKKVQDRKAKKSAAQETE